MSTDERRPRRVSIGVMVAALLAALLILAGVLFWLAQNTAAPTSPQTNGSLGPLVVMVPALL